MNKSLIDHFLWQGPFLFKKGKQTMPEIRCKEDCSTEVEATIVRGYTEGISNAMWRARLCNTQQSDVY